MSAKVSSLICLLVAFGVTFGQENSKKLPVLFQFSQPSHNVAVFRGADLKKAIAAGIVPGFGSLSKASVSADLENTDQEARDGRSDDDSDAAADASASVDDASATDADANAEAASGADEKAAAAPAAAVSSYTPAPVVYRPAPVVYRPAPVVYKPAPAPVVIKQAPVVYRPAPAPVVYKPAPAPVVVKPAPAVAYQPYVDPYPAEDAIYTYQYAVKDDYSGNDFGAQEARERELTNGQYNVLLPDGRLQTVTYTVNGGDGYVADVQYAGEAQYPVAVAPAPTYSS